MFKVVGRQAFAIAVFCALAGGSFGTAAQAVERNADIPSITVRYGDLDLNTAEGVDALYARLRAAARSACRQHEGRALVNAVAWRTCYDQALSLAVSNVKSETLNALHHVSSARENLS